MSRNVTAPLRYGGASGRRAAILQRLRQSGYVSLLELSTRLDVSDRTIRRDLTDLAADGSLAIVPGGATLPAGEFARAPFSARAVREADTKRRIAEVARGLVQPGDAVGIDAGSTAAIVAAALTDVSPLTVISSSLEVINQFSDDTGASLIAVGGSFDRDRRAFLGPMTRACLEDMRLTTAFVACSGVYSAGFACTSQADAEIKRVLLDIAERRVLVATSSVFGRVAPIRMADFERIDTLITDPDITDESRRRVESAGVAVLLAAPAEAR